MSLSRCNLSIYVILHFGVKTCTETVHKNVKLYDVECRRKPKNLNEKIQSHSSLVPDEVYFSRFDENKWVRLETRVVSYFRLVIII